jgi:hypothetical protein
MSRFEQYRFKPGQSGNPGGRPKGVARLVREQFGDDPNQLVQVLWEIASDKSQKASDRLRALQDLLDRGWGKAPAVVATEHEEPQQMDDIDCAIERLIEKRAQQIAADRFAAGSNGAEETVRLIGGIEAA